MRVVFTRKAEIGLAAVGDDIARDNPRRAASFVRELQEAARAIADAPQAFALVPSFEDNGIRRRPYRNYLIFYVAKTDHILIVHIAHGAQDYTDDLPASSDF